MNWRIPLFEEESNNLSSTESRRRVSIPEVVLSKKATSTIAPQNPPKTQAQNKAAGFLHPPRLSLFMMILHSLAARSIYRKKPTPITRLVNETPGTRNRRNRDKAPSFLTHTFLSKKSHAHGRLASGAPQEPPNPKISNEEISTPIPTSLIICCDITDEDTLLTPAWVGFMYLGCGIPKYSFRTCTRVQLSVTVDQCVPKA